MNAKIAELLTDEKLRAREFPVVAERIFMAHAGVCPLPRAVVEAMRGYLRGCEADQQEFGTTMQEIAETRTLVGELFGARADEIALLGPTSLGLSLVAAGIDWRAGDEVIFYPDDYPANVYPWRNLEQRGVVLRPLKPEQLGKITPELVAANINSKTRLCALASCHYLSGWRLDYEKIADILAEKGVLFCLDGIQTLGISEVELRKLDFMSADAHKWLLGPMASGIFYVKKSRQLELSPSLLGAWNAISPNFVAADKLDFYEGARRYEPGALNIAGIIGLKASLTLIKTYGGVEAIAARIASLREFIIALAEENGLRELLAKDDAHHASGIISFVAKGRNLSELFSRLAAENINLSLRHTREGEELLRFSPHFYNTEEEVERIFALIKKWR